MALVAGAAGIVIGNVVESAVIATVGADPGELAWISDAFLAGGLAAATFLWLHLKEAARKVTELERSKIAVDAQLRLAAEIQTNLLPRLPEKAAGCRWAARLVSAWAVGGDFYDFVLRDDGSAVAIVGDVSGKGIPAALVHASLRALFREAVRSTAEPAAIAARLSQGLYADNAGAPYATAFLLRIEPASRRLTYVNAGHPPALLRTASGSRVLESNAPPLGILPSLRFEDESVDLGPGDLGVVVTDGVTEALEGVPTTVAGVLDSTPATTPAAACDLLVRAAANAPGPPGVDGWYDDRTAFAFQAD